ncbi:rho family member [Naegleria gruberi]|uniref:Rho family member n=1 Tax=Naegleria gruberi TaxID=5762 RepID=D2VPB9_NAEGR|nr:rho family member [Naegleria gruberi]EFC41408.1 rho family member [Naegleria gruberi]|eukprot:XP_002674152.1 rho family member [Naegleria gruberi strain NEG-M]
MNHHQRVSNDEWMLICSFINVKSLVNYMMVCKEFYVIGSSDLLWKKHYDRKLENYSKVKPVLEYGYACHYSILMKEDPKENYYLHYLQVCGMELLKFTENYEYESYDKILQKSVEELKCPLPHFKVAVLGDHHSGVTDLLKRLGKYNLDNQFQYHISIEGRKFCIDFVDVSDMDYERMIPLLMFGSDLFVATFPFRRVYGLERIKSKWLPYANHYMPHTPMLILGTQKDLKTKEDDVTVQNAIKFCKEHKCLTYYEISSLEDGDEIMTQFVELCIKSALMTHAISVPKRKKKRCSLQ